MNMNNKLDLDIITDYTSKASKGVEDLYWSVQSDLNGMYDNNNEQLKDMLYAAKLAQALEAMKQARILIHEVNKLDRATFKRAS